MPTVAALDLGTNTFHILIADIDKNVFHKVYQERIFTKLGEEGTQKIGKRSFQRGIEALDHFNNLIKEHKVDHIKALGTAALRDASNGADFIKEAAEKFDIHIELIDGLREADFIYRGVQLAIPQQNAPYIIMDIGGGSVEFIIANSSQIVYKESFKIGLSPLHSVVDISNVARVEDVAQIHRWLVGKLGNLYKAIQQYNPQNLIGSAGAFEVLLSMNGNDFNQSTWSSITQSNLSKLYIKVLGSSRDEKLSMLGLPVERVDYISAALVLIWHVMDTVSPEQILISKYALKEGVLSTFLD